MREMLIGLLLFGSIGLALAAEGKSDGHDSKRSKLRNESKGKHGTIRGAVEPSPHDLLRNESKGKHGTIRGAVEPSPHDLPRNESKRKHSTVKGAIEQSPHDSNRLEVKGKIGTMKGTIKTPEEGGKKRKPISGVDFGATMKEKEGSVKKSLFATTKKSIASRSWAAIFENGEEGDKQQKDEDSLSQSDEDEGEGGEGAPFAGKKVRTEQVGKAHSLPDSKQEEEAENKRARTKKNLQDRKERCLSLDANQGKKIDCGLKEELEVPQTQPEKRRGYHSDGSDSEAEADPKKLKEFAKNAKGAAGGRKAAAPRKAVGGTRLEDSDSGEYVITNSEEEDHHLFKPETGEQEQRPRRKHQYGGENAEEYMWHPPGQQVAMQSAPQMAQMNPFLMQQQLMQQQMMMMQSAGMMGMNPMSGANMPAFNNPPVGGGGGGATTPFHSAAGNVRPRSVMRKGAAVAKENPAIGPLGMASKLMGEGIEALQRQGDGGFDAGGANEAQAAPSVPNVQQTAMVPQMIPMLTPFGIVYMPATSIGDVGPLHPDDEHELPDPLDEHVVLNFIATTKKGKLIAKNTWRLCRIIGMAAVWTAVVMIIWIFGLENIILDIPPTNTTTA